MGCLFWWGLWEVVAGVSSGRTRFVNLYGGHDMSSTNEKDKEKQNNTPNKTWWSLKASKSVRDSFRYVGTQNYILCLQKLKADIKDLSITKYSNIINEIYTVQIM